MSGAAPPASSACDPEFRFANYEMLDLDFRVQLATKLALAFAIWKMDFLE